jgi:hypothetical protein
MHPPSVTNKIETLCGIVYAETTTGCPDEGHDQWPEGRSIIKDGNELPSEK